METKYFKYFMNMVMLSFVLITVLNSAFLQIGYNFIGMLSNFFKQNIFNGVDLEKSIYLLAGVCVIIVALSRDTWLPFLSESVLPSIFVPLKNIEGDTIVKVLVKPNTKVAYWAAKPSLKKSNKDPDVTVAYDDYSNSGVVMSDENGVAILTLNKGSGYYVPSGKHISSHVHYRELTNEYALMGEVKTHYF